ncbi:hypothetical protein ATCC90586_007590 [Pythium insidiosum]|nr:hypothetical protein ATCC90586_007590 [Pythium insidiosum]
MSSSAFRSKFLYPAKINWFPGHMAVARRQMLAQLDSVDVLIEVRDARIPWSSANPILEETFGLSKPRLIVFNKSDLANSNMQSRIEERCRQRNVPCLFTSVTKGRKIQSILQWCNAHSGAQFKKTAGTMVMVVGIPNVGKSSIINEFRRLSSSQKLSKGKKRAAVGPTPGVTVRNDIIKVNDKPAIYVVDTPGVMLPNVESVEEGMRLALTGAIKDDVIGKETIADYMLFKLNQMKSTRYVDALKLPGPTDDIQHLLKHSLRFCSAGGKEPDVQKQLAAEFLLKEFRRGTFGQFTLDPVVVDPIIPKSLTPTSIPEELHDRDVVSSNLSGGFSPTQRKTKVGMGITSAHDLKINFFNRTKTHRNGEQPLTKQEDIGISFISLRFSNLEMEQRFAMARNAKYQTRLRFGAAFTAFFIPLLVIMQVSFKSKGTTEKWTQVPLVMIFPGVVMIMGLLVIFFQRFFQRNTRLLMLVCLVGQVSALLDTTAAGTYVSERNVWVQFIFSLGITSSTGIGFLESTVVLVVSSIFFIILAWVRFAMGEVDSGGIGCQKTTLSSPGTVSAAVVLYSILLAFLAWNWEYEERRDFVLTERLAKENVMVQMTMEMTGWFSGGATENQNHEAVSAGILSANCHIDPKDVLVKEELGQGTFGCVYAATWKETKVAVKKITLQGDTKSIVTSFGSEASVMAQLRHPNVVMFMGVMVHPEFVGLVMELCPKGSVYTVLHTEQLQIDWSLLLRMLVDSSRGMHFLHTSSPPILHRDLKSVNLLIDADWRCKVSDFGLSKLKAFRDDNDKSSAPSRAFIGSSIWIAPEVFKGEQHTEKSDVYSFGIVIFECLSRSIPYASISIDAVPFVVQSGKRPTDFFTLETPQAPEMQDLFSLMTRCWSVEDNVRPSFSIIISTLQSILAKHVGDEKWEDHIIFPDRKIVNNKTMLMDTDGLSIREEDLVIEGIIGRGVFGVVYKGSYFGTPVAIKKLHISSVPKNTLAEFEKECTIMKGLHHPNIVLFMGSCSKPPSLLLVTELLANGSFFDIYHKLPRPEAAQQLRLAYNIAFDMARGLAYLHNHNPIVIHRDLKSQNILLDDKMRTKIADFGLSKFRDVGKTMSICGSPLWVAPEVLRGEKYGCPCDVYSFSIIVWEALAWGEPYPDLGSSDIMNGVACGNLRPVVPDGTPTGLANLLEECWTKKQDQRPTFNEIIPRLDAMAKDFAPR